MAPRIAMSVWCMETVLTNDVRQDLVPNNQDHGSRRHGHAHPQRGSVAHIASGTSVQYGLENVENCKWCSDRAIHNAECVTRVHRAGAVWPLGCALRQSPSSLEGGGGER